jgi:Cupin domain
VLVPGADTDGRWSPIEWVAAPVALGAGHGAHLHRHSEESFLIRRETLGFPLGDEVTILGAGDFLCVRPGVRHGYANVSGAPVEMLVSFHPAGLEALFVKYRTNGETGGDGAGFIAAAARLHASEFQPG